MSSNELAILTAYFKNVSTPLRREIIAKNNALTGRKDVSLPRSLKYWAQRGTPINEIIPKVLSLTNVIENEQRLKEISNLSALSAQRRENQIMEDNLRRNDLRYILNEATDKVRQQDLAKERQDALNRNYRNTLNQITQRAQDLEKQRITANLEAVRQGEIRNIKGKIDNLIINKQPLSFDITKDLYAKNTTTGDLIDVVISRVIESDKIGMWYLENGEKKYIILNDHTLNSLKSNYANGSEGNAITNYSDQWVTGAVRCSTEVGFYSVSSSASYSNKSGKFMSYINETEMDFSKYGLYKDISKNVVSLITKSNCLYLALKDGGLDGERLSFLKSSCVMRYVSKSKLKNIANDLGIVIKLSEYVADQIDNRKILKSIHGDGINSIMDNDGKIIRMLEDEIVFDVALFEGHYFIDEEVKYTEYSIKHYHEVKNEKDFNFINKVKVRNGKSCYNREKQNPRFISSLEAFILMKECRHISKMTRDTENILSTVFYDKLETNFDNMNIYEKNFKYADKAQEFVKTANEICGDNAKLTREKYKSLDTGVSLEFAEFEYVEATFDFETRSLPTGEIVSYLGVLAYSEDEIYRVVGKNYDEVGRELLKKINRNTQLIAHNAKFDYGFIAKHMYRLEEVLCDGRFISSKGMFAKFHLKVVDFYNFLALKLLDIGTTFKIEQEKEFLPYELYNDYDLRECRFLEYSKIIDNKKYFKNEDEVKIFNENCEKWDLFRCEKTMVDVVKYSMEYCVIDCLVLLKSWRIFKNMVMESVGINILFEGILTASGIARKLLQKRDCLVDCYKHNGVFQDYISKFCVGGRTMTANNVKHYIKGLTNAMDAKSLYPSAIKELGGYLKGKPRTVAINTPYEFLRDYTDGYFIRIKVLSVGRKLKMPLLSRFVNGVRIFTNDICGEDLHFVDKITLEDLIEFQQVTFEIVDGYYYDEGRNTGIVNLIQELYNSRKECVKNENSMELVYKLIMNSAYGINLENPHDEKVRIFDDKKAFDVYLDRNSQAIVEYMPFGEKKHRVISKNEIESHYNTNHIGCEILSMSKRIMNRLICMMEINDCNVYYQDTDSIFYDAKDTEKIISLYKSTYNKNLVGCELGEFAMDLKIKSTDGNKVKNVLGVESIFLGKKCYYVKMEGVNNKGETKTEDKLRMAGIPASTLEYTTNKLKISNGAMYSKLYNGDAIEYDLCEYNEEFETTKFKVSYDKNLKKTLNKEFTRTRVFK